MPFPFFLAAKYLKPKRSWTSAVTFLATLGVVLGVAIIIIVRAVMTGFGDMWHEKILAFKPHITVSDYNGVIGRVSALTNLLSGIEGVTAVSPGIEIRVLAEHDRHVIAPVVVGVEPDGIANLHPMLAANIVKGTANIEGDNILVGVDLAADLGVTVGDKILIYSPMNLVGKDEVFFPEEMIVGGIFDMGQRDYDSGFIITSVGFARDLLDLRQDTAYSVHIKTADPQNEKEFSKILLAVRQALPPRYEIRTWQEVDRDLFNAIAVEKNMMVILLAFISIVAMFCVSNTLIVMTVSKTNEIGLLKALGFSGWKIMSTFLLYGWIQCLAGTALGVALAGWILHNLQALVEFLAKCGVDVFPKAVYGLPEIPHRIIPSELCEVVVMVVAFCTVASFIPAWIAARKDPAEALRG